MKPTPNTKKFRRFTAAIQTILTVSKTELLAREKQAKDDRKAKREERKAKREAKRAVKLASASDKPSG